MLQWVGKTTADVVHYFPAQVCETVGVSNPPDNPTYQEFSKSDYNLLFHGDNREILSTLLTNGFRGKIDLIYIDPPFDSGVDYVRKVSLRGQREKLSAEGSSLIEQCQYEDIWANDNYLQFMYERLILMRELLSSEGNIFLHCDWHKNHYLRILLDEIFGESNFRNEIIWGYRRWTASSNTFQKSHDSIYWYSKTSNYIWNQQFEPYADEGRHFSEEDDAGKYRWQYLDGKKYKLYEKEGTRMKDWWEDISYINSMAHERTDYRTQKPLRLLERIIQASSNDDSVVLDCFCGSGTAAAAAEELGRRWIVADINKGAIQTTMKRLQTQTQELNSILPKRNKTGFIHYRINNYEAAKQQELKNYLVAKYGIQKVHQDLYFDGLVGGQLAKIIDLNRPLNKLDLQLIRDEIQNNRPDETRNIHVFCNGSEIGLIAELEQDKMPINKFVIQDVQQDGLITNQPVEAEIEFAKAGHEVTVKIVNFIDPTILARLDVDRTLFDEQVDDFRAQIDYVLIDTDYTNNLFESVHCDIPGKKSDYVDAEYKLNIPRADSKVALKIVSMLGEEYFKVFG